MLCLSNNFGGLCWSKTAIRQSTWMAANISFTIKRKNSSSLWNLRRFSAGVFSRISRQSRPAQTTAIKAYRHEISTGLLSRLLLVEFVALSCVSHTRTEKWRWHRKNRLLAFSLAVFRFIICLERHIHWFFFFLIFIHDDDDGDETRQNDNDTTLLVEQLWVWRIFIHLFQAKKAGSSCKVAEITEISRLSRQPLTFHIIVEKSPTHVIRGWKLFFLLFSTWYSSSRVSLENVLFPPRYSCLSAAKLGKFLLIRQFLS